MGLTKRVPAKTHDHVPNRGKGFGGYPPGSGTCGKTFKVIPKFAFTVLLGHDLAQSISFSMGKSGNGHGRPRDIFLINHNAEGLLKYIS